MMNLVIQIIYPQSLDCVNNLFSFHFFFFTLLSNCQGSDFAQSSPWQQTEHDPYPSTTTSDFFLLALGSEALLQGQPWQETELPLICWALQGTSISISSSDTHNPAWVVSGAGRRQSHGVRSKQQLCIIQTSMTKHLHNGFLLCCRHVDCSSVWAERFQWVEHYGDVKGWI